MMARRDKDSGVVLINVLVILALTASVVFAMVSLSDLAIQRSQRYSAAGQALALIAAGEASAIVALRRDMTEAPLSDNPTEAWAQSGQQEVEIAGGSFALRIEDAQSRFNLNSLPQSGALGLQILQRIVKSLDLPPDVALRIAARLAQPAPLIRLQDLIAEAGLTPNEVTRLSQLATVLPGRTDINLNTAPAALLGVLADNAVQANRLEGLRKRKGFLTADDLATANVILPLGTGFVSRYFQVTVDVTLGDSAQHMQTLLQRRNGPGGEGQVVAVFRQSPITAAPPPS
jgi:general secretion pathway protein K